MTLHPYNMMERGRASFGFGEGVGLFGVSKKIIEIERSTTKGMLEPVFLDYKDYREIVGDALLPLGL
jgi:hypothetical protein